MQTGTARDRRRPRHAGVHEPRAGRGDEGLDARTDIYSLAACCTRCSPEPPLTGATTQALMVKRLTKLPPSARATRPNVPDAVDQAIRKALSPVPADRFGTMAQFAAGAAGHAPRRRPAAGTVDMTPIRPPQAHSSLILRARSPNAAEFRSPRPRSCSASS